jgi:hypothetical protein
MLSDKFANHTKEFTIDSGDAVNFWSLHRILTSNNHLGALEINKLPGQGELNDSYPASCPF